MQASLEPQHLGPPCLTDCAAGLNQTGERSAIATDGQIVIGDDDQVQFGQSEIALRGARRQPSWNQQPKNTRGTRNGEYGCVRPNEWEAIETSRKTVDRSF